MTFCDEEELNPTRASLLGRLRDWEDQKSWREFFDAYWMLIYSAARQAGLSDSEAQDVVQETVVSAAKNLPEFRYDPARGSFKSWLLQLTRWRIADQFRKRMRRPVEIKDDDHSDAGIGEIADPNSEEFGAVLEQEWQRGLIEAAVQKVKRAVDPKQFQIFDLYVVKNWPAAKVAQSLSVNRAGVYLAKHRISALIKKEVTCMLKANH